MNAKNEKRPHSPEDERRATRTIYILYAVMIVFILLPPLVAWACGFIGEK